MARPPCDESPRHPDVGHNETNGLTMPASTHSRQGKLRSEQPYSAPPSPIQRPAENGQIGRPTETTNAAIPAPAIVNSSERGHFIRDDSRRDRQHDTGSPPLSGEGAGKGSLGP
jgi:hypothetical protein